MNPQETEPDLPVFGILQQRHGWQWPATGSGALTAPVLGSTMCWHKSFWRRLPTSLLELASGQTIGREHRPTHQRKIGLKIFVEQVLAQQSKTQFSPQPVPPTRKLIQVSYPHLSEGRRNENHNHRKLKQTDHMGHSFE